MSGAANLGWEAANQCCLLAAISEVRAALEKLLAPAEAQRAKDAPKAQIDPQVRDSMPAPPAIETLCAAFGLSSFERKVVLLCAAMELDSGFASLVGTAQKDARSAQPTFSLALAAFEDAHWSALLPSHPLRFWHLVEVQSGDTLATSALRIDERILHYLAGVASMDERLRGLSKPADPVTELLRSQNAVAAKVAGIWSRSNLPSLWPVAQLCGIDQASKRAVAATACDLLGLHLRYMPSRVIPHGMADLDLFLRLWERETALNPGGLLIEYDDAESREAHREAAFKYLLENLRSPLLISTREFLKPVDRRVVSFDVPGASAAEQRQIWKQALGPAAAVLNGQVDMLVTQFNLDASAIHAAVAQALPPDDSAVASPEGEPQETGLSDVLWDACRVQARPRLDGLAQRIESSATWDDLVLPETHKHLLSQIALHIRHRSKVYQTWGFEGKGSRGLGIGALFAGPSGTGKTMAGEILAHELRLDLYRIDLSQVVSKYIGETEKNLRRVFDAAEGGSAILLFDEADALFGKRSEVKDSHDRYANIEVGYLLQRMEAYRGLSILTTNRKESLDTAFLRRIRFVIEFPFPDAVQRAGIWRRVFPRQTPTEGLRIDLLARLTAAGGNIHNIAIGAAFLAADAGEPVRMSHLLSAARSEFTKIERHLTDSETAGWV